MDQHLQDVFGRIKQEVNQLHERWKLYKQMFATNPHRIKLINDTSPCIFIEFQWLVIDYMIMSLSKLIDPAEMGKNNKNLSYPYLIERVEALGEIKLADQLKVELAELQTECVKIRNIRNKRISHSDLFTALAEESSPLPGLSRAEIEKALVYSRSIMNKIELHFNGKQTLYEEIVLPLTNDGRSLLIWLQKGLAYEQLEKEGKIEKGKWKELGNIDS